MIGTVHPIEIVQWRDPDSLSANFWNPNRVKKQEFRLLERSILENGWIQPLLITTDDIIIDGFHRWRLAQDSKAIREFEPRGVPCAVLDIPEDEAMAVTVRINRAKGASVAVEMHHLVARLRGQFGWDRERVAKAIGATPTEVDLLAQDGVFAAKDIANWKYSAAWYPVECPPEDKPEKPEFMENR